MAESLLGDSIVAGFISNEELIALVCAVRFVRYTVAAGPIP